MNTNNNNDSHDDAPYYYNDYYGDEDDEIIKMHDVTTKHHLNNGIGSNAQQKLTCRSLNAALLAYRNDPSMSSSGGGGQKAECTLKHMEELTNDGIYDVMLDVIAWNTAIGTIARCNNNNDDDKCDAAECATKLLRKMQTKAKNQALLLAQQQSSLSLSPTSQNNNNDNNMIVYPDGVTHSHVIEAWLKRNDNEGAQMAQQLSDEFYTNRPKYQLKSEPVWNVLQAYNSNQNKESKIKQSKMKKETKK